MLPRDPGDDRDIPVQHAQAMAHGSTIIRPGAVAWGGSRDAPNGAYPSIEAVEQLLAAVSRDPGHLGALLTELSGTRLLVPLPAGRPFTDGSAVVLPTVRSADGDLIPCFTSVQRLEAWAKRRRWRRAGDARALPHIVVPVAPLARRLPPGTGLVINPESGAGLPLYPESVAYLARLPAARLVPAARPAAETPGAAPGRAAPGGGETGGADTGGADTGGADTGGADTGGAETAAAETAAAETGGYQGTSDQGTGDQGTGDQGTGDQGTGIQVGDPPAEPVALLRQALAGLRALPAVRQAARAWLTVPGRGEGLVISVTLDDPASDSDRMAVIAALTRAVASVPLQAPFPVDVTFPGEPSPDGAGGPEVIDAWVAANACPFYTRG